MLSGGIITEALCLALILVGAVVLGWSSVRHYRTLAFMRARTYDRQFFSIFVCGLSIIMIIVIFTGYIFVATAKETGTFDPEFLLVASIFFLSSLVVMFMVNMQQKLMGAIANKRLDTIHSMICAIEAKDIYTKGHSEQVYHLVGLIYHRLPGPMKAQINLVRLKDAAMLHDIGKIGIPDNILNKPGKLTSEEWAILKQHPQRGRHILERTSFREICDVILYHHERMDGKGYYGLPSGLIPLESRIIAVADTFSALYADRVYRKKYSFDEAHAILRASAGSHLDPMLVEIFCGLSEERINAMSLPVASKDRPSCCSYCELTALYGATCPRRKETRRGPRFSRCICPKV